MKSPFFRSLPIALVCASVGVAQTWTLQVGGVERTALVYAPKDLATNRPLFISMHGMSGDGAMQKMMAKVEAIADTAKFLLVYPNGLEKKWDVSGTTDIDFLLKIIDSAATRYGIDRTRVYTSGFSMGGMMSYHMACKQPDKVAAIGPVAGYALGGQYNCAKTRPVPIIHIHGDLDTIVGFAGLRPFLLKKGTEYGCPTVSDTTKPYPVSKPTSKVTKEHWGPCDKSGKKSEITFMTVADMSHNYTTGPHINMSEEIWNFVKQYSTGESGVWTRPRADFRAASTRLAGGALQVESGSPIQRIRVLDSWGRILTSWDAGQAPSSSISLSLGRERRGILLVEVATHTTRTTWTLAAP
ncbi:MAG: hypothetical protein IPO40_22480 [Fibrobacteres bacterium]|nr:hypothetical protein [Fibrobacterota bacterium]